MADLQISKIVFDSNFSYVMSRKKILSFKNLFSIISKFAKKYDRYRMQLCNLLYSSFKLLNKRVPTNSI